MSSAPHSLSRLRGEVGERSVGARGSTSLDAGTPLPTLPLQGRGRKKHAATMARLMFMTSAGGLTAAELFQGKDAILSGPAGGVVGLAETGREAGFSKLIGFDMGGTSTDVSHFDGGYERAFETEVAGVRMRAPMMLIHTVAAGGGSILHFDGARFRVGPDSAGANPGPKSYRRGGPLTVTDANVMAGKLIPDFFPKIFGTHQNEPLDADAVREAFASLARESGRAAEEVADGFLRIAVENMANAIKKISVQRGYDVTRYALNCFGGAGGQHACLVADALGMTTVLIHPFSSLLSAYGMGLADIRATRQQAIELPLNAKAVAALNKTATRLGKDASKEVAGQGVPRGKIKVIVRAHIRYAGTDTALEVPAGVVTKMQSAFEKAHKARFGFIDRSKTAGDRSRVGGSHRRRREIPRTGETQERRKTPLACAPHAFLLRRQMAQGVGVHPRSAQARRENPRPRHRDRAAPDRGGRNRLARGAHREEPSRAHAREAAQAAERRRHQSRSGDAGSVQQPVHGHRRADGRGAAEHGLFGEHQGAARFLLRGVFRRRHARRQRAAYAGASRLDGPRGRDHHPAEPGDPSGRRLRDQRALQRRHASARHHRLHAGVLRRPSPRRWSGGEAVRARAVDAGTRWPLPPSPAGSGETPPEILFWVASRGHHADIGGIAPGSMSPDAVTIGEEGVYIDNFKLVDRGRFREKDLQALLTGAAYPARNPTQNVADLKAQIAANEKGAQELHKMVAQFGLATVQAYMGHVQDNAAESVRRVIDKLHDSEFTYEMDQGTQIKVKISVDRKKREATVDFTGTSPQQPDNFNAPEPVTRAAVLYVFRVMVDDDIPMNAGCLRPIRIVIPPRSMLSPEYPAAVVAGNVETSQAVTNCLFGALGAMAAAQGTMNNLNFGNARYQYYETICSGSPAGPGFPGTDAVQTHMTNTRLTDPEVLELRYPVLLEDFHIRKGSGGRGKWNAGDGISRTIRFLEKMQCTILSGHRRVRPFGLKGGEAGQVGENSVRRKDGRIEKLKACDSTLLDAGEAVTIKTPTAGGYGKANE